MPAKHKDFGSPIASSDEPITFSIYGETFRCRPTMQGTTLIHFIADSAQDDPSAGARAVLNFFDKAIIKEDHERWSELTESDQTVVPMETLSEIMDWLVSQYSARPTEPPTPSQPGDTTTGTMPVAAPSSPPVPVSVS
jgi:hypothetical protein